ncbi:MAG: Gfo/Idh/MocA family oxidoreductase [Eubacteriales bacterium]|nr:Gfo/Idh/MocA family oxidoreductase [Eubacteriales bacterium]
MNMAVMGTGRIAGIMADTINGMAAQGMKAPTLYAAASRSADKAAAFARERNFAKAYGSYEEMLNDEKVELVYVATPHSSHYQNVLDCLRHGKHVLCEKAFTVNAAQAREVCGLAEEKGLLLTEAIWTRYMPVRQMVDDIIAAGEIGRPRMLTANLCYDSQKVERIRRPELAGGALLDLGVYPLTFASMVFGDDVEQIDTSAVLMDTGVDLQESITLRYRDGRMASINASVNCMGDRRGVVFGELGYLEVDAVNNATRVTVCTDSNQPDRARVIEVPKQITGYEYEVLSCIRAIEAGRTECPEMPHSETIRMLEWMDELREKWGVHYPCE